MYINLKGEFMKQTFKQYLNFIKNETIRGRTEYAIDNLPEYFWIKPASSSGRYHLSISNVEGGLVIHTMIATDILLELYNVVALSQFEKDVGISAILLHDCQKYGL